MPDKSARLENGLVRLDFPYDPRMVSDLKDRFENATFDNYKKCWYVDPDSITTNSLYLFFKKWYVVPEDDLVGKISDEKARRKEILRKSMLMKAEEPSKHDHPPGLNYLPFQEAGIDFIMENGGRVLISDECGLGKTVETLGYARAVDHLPMLVICPLVGRANWRFESGRWLELPPDKIAITGSGHVKPSVDALRGKKVTITNYDIVSKYIDIFDELPFKLLVLDECHLIKNYKAKRTKAIVQLAQGIEDKICITGTPVMNKPIELYPILQVLERDKGDFAFWNFAKKYCDAKKKWVPGRDGGREVWDTSGASNLEELNEKLRKNVMLRRYKEDVFKELKPLNRMMVRIELEHSVYKKFKDIEADFVEYYEQTRGKPIFKGKKLVFIETMRKLAAEGKMDQAIEFIDNIYQEKGKVIVFAHHSFVLDNIGSFFSKKTTFLRIDGDTTSKARERNVETFNALDDTILACSITASSTSMNLQTCSNIVFVEVTWVPADHQQAEARAHRIGQKDVVNIHYLIADNTIEEKVFNVLDKKENIVKKVVK